MKGYFGIVLTIWMILLASCSTITPFSDVAVQVETTIPEQPAGGLDTQASCSGKLTSSNQEGPYYSPGSPEKSSLIEPRMAGEVILIQGMVFNQDCLPLKGAKVDLWQTDANGVYDNEGYRLRGHVITDDEGTYAVETIVPGLYTGRPPHIHVKVFASDGRELLTSQLYFPGSEDSVDVRSAPDLLVVLQDQVEGPFIVNFNFIVRE